MLKWHENCLEKCKRKMIRIIYSPRGKHEKYGEDCDYLGGTYS